MGAMAFMALHLLTLASAWASEAQDHATLTASWANGLHMQTADERFRISLGGTIMADWAAAFTDKGDDDALAEQRGFGSEFRRARLNISGSIFESVEFKAQWNFADDEVRTEDLWMALTDLPVVGMLKIGNFKEPFSLEEQTSSRYITFMERGLPLALAPSYNRGLAVGTDFLDGRGSWTVGVFEETQGGQARHDNHDDWNATARATFAPVHQAQAERLLHLGAAYSHGFRAGAATPLRYSASPETHLLAPVADTRGNTSFLAVDEDIPVDRVDLFGGEAATVLGPLSLQSEAIFALVNPDRPGGEAMDSDGDFLFWGYYIFASYFLTGEHRPYSNGSFGRVKPRRDFDLKDGGWGAWELAARWSYLDLNDSLGQSRVRGGKLGDMTLGGNWYLNPHARVMLNYIYSTLDERGFQAEAVDNESLHAVQMRFQVDW